jgi:hypothetical protein
MLGFAFCAGFCFQFFKNFQEMSLAERLFSMILKVAWAGLQLLEPEFHIQGGAKHHDFAEAFSGFFEFTGGSTSEEVVRRYSHGIKISRSAFLECGLGVVFHQIPVLIENPSRSAGRVRGQNIGRLLHETEVGFGIVVQGPRAAQASSNFRGFPLVSIGSRSSPLKRPFRGRSLHIGDASGVTS